MYLLTDGTASDALHETSRRRRTAGALRHRMCVQLVWARGAGLCEIRFGSDARVIPVTV